MNSTHALLELRKSAISCSEAKHQGQEKWDNNKVKNSCKVEPYPKPAPQALPDFQSMLPYSKQQYHKHSEAAHSACVCRKEVTFLATCIQSQANEQIVYSCCCAAVRLNAGDCSRKQVWQSLILKSESINSFFGYRWSVSSVDCNFVHTELRV